MSRFLKSILVSFLGFILIKNAEAIEYKLKYGGAGAQVRPVCKDRHSATMYLIALHHQMMDLRKTYADGQRALDNRLRVHGGDLDCANTKNVAVFAESVEVVDVVEEAGLEEWAPYAIYAVYSEVRDADVPTIYASDYTNTPLYALVSDKFVIKNK